MAPFWTQVGLDLDQVRDFGGWLAREPEAHQASEVEDPGNPNPGFRIRAEWNATAARLMITHPDGAATLMPPEVARLARFLNAGSPGPA